MCVYVPVYGVCICADMLIEHRMGIWYDSLILRL